MAGILSKLTNFLERIGSQMMGDPADYGYSDAEMARIVEGARGRSVSSDSLLGLSHEKHPPIALLHEDEQPHHCIPVSDLDIVGDGRETDGGAGKLVVTEDRVLFVYSSGLSQHSAAIDLSEVSSVEVTEGPVHTRLSVQADARTFSAKSGADQWGEELRRAEETIWEFH